MKYLVRLSRSEYPYYLMRLFNRGIQEVRWTHRIRHATKFDSSEAASEFLKLAGVIPQTSVISEEEAQIIEIMDA